MLMQRCGSVVSLEPVEKETGSYKLYKLNRLSTGTCLQLVHYFHEMEKQILKETM